MSQFQQRLLRDLKASWQKTVLLGVLLLVGLFYWVPPLVKGVIKPSPSQAVSAGISTKPSASKPKGDPSQTPQRETISSKVSTTLHWKVIEQAMQEHPLFADVSLEHLPKDPFHINQDQFPPPILFAEEPTPTVILTPTSSQETNPIEETALELKSVIIGPRRRSAFISGKLYDLGETIDMDDNQYQILQIEPGLVVLRSGGKTLELTIRRPGLSPPSE